MKKRFSKEQIIGFLHRVDGDLPAKDLCGSMDFWKRATSCGAASSAA